MLKHTLTQLIEKRDLTKKQIEEFIQDFLETGNTEMMAAFLVLLRTKGESTTEIAAIVRLMQRSMVVVNPGVPVMDIVGTGGDLAHTINISTGSAIVAASCGVNIAKHGSRSVSSLCGSADVLEALGIPLLNSPHQVEKCIQDTGIGFMYAPHFHPIMQKISLVRRSLKVRTVFNMIGPLLNPARPEVLMIGVFQSNLLYPIGLILKEMKVKKAFVFHGQGLDELSSIGPADYLEVTSTGIRSGTIDPKEYGLKPCTVQELKGGNSIDNASLLELVFQGASCPIADTLALNAGVALWMTGIASSIEEGVECAQSSLKNALPFKKLEQWRAACKTF